MVHRSAHATWPQTIAHAHAGDYHTCGIHANTKLYCFGYNSDGQVGDSGNVNRMTPTRVSIGASPLWMKLSLGTLISCAIDVNGFLYCWGNNAYGSLGEGTIVDRNTARATNQIVPFASVAVGSTTTCAVPGTPTPVRSLPPLPPAPPGFEPPACWGTNNPGNGLFGDSKYTASRKSPPNATVVPWGFLSLSDTAGCAIVQSNGGLMCWSVHSVAFWVIFCVAAGRAFIMPSHTAVSSRRGLGSYGGLGDGTVTSHYTPLPLALGGKWKAVHVGSYFGCAINTLGRLYCWQVEGSARWDLLELRDEARVLLLVLAAT